MVSATLKELKDLQFRLSCAYPDKCVSIEINDSKPKLCIQ
jgi:hypothetical protein